MQPSSFQPGSALSPTPIMPEQPFVPESSKMTTAPPSIAPTEANISNTELTNFWSDYLIIFSNEINWDTFFLFIIDSLQVRAPFKLDTEKLRKKMDLKMNSNAPTLKKVYQMIQDKSPEEFFGRYVVDASTIRSSVLEGGQDVAATSPRSTVLPPRSTVVPPRSTVVPPRSTVVPPRSEKKALANLQRESISNTNQIATKATEYDGPAPTAARKKKNMIYLCIGIFVLIGIVAAAVFLFVPIKS
jgi:hypothetical protein